MPDIRNKTDKTGYDEYYKGNLSSLLTTESPEEFIAAYEGRRIAPFWSGGETKGYVRGEAVRNLIADAYDSGRPFSEIVILDAGFGQGELSVYLGCLGFTVVSVDISTQAKACAEALAESVGVIDRIEFLAESLEETSIDENSVDYMIGHASLHHFIKYEGVPSEFKRVMKPGAKGYFADSFGENRLYHIFHDKEKMRRLGDVTLTKSLIDNYFNEFEVRLMPTDWFVMLDKLYIKLLPGAMRKYARAVSRFHFFLDRRIPSTSRLALKLSGSVLTEIHNIR